MGVESEADSPSAGVVATGAWAGADEVPVGIGAETAASVGGVDVANHL